MHIDLHAAQGDLGQRRLGLLYSAPRFFVPGLVHGAARTREAAQRDAAQDEDEAAAREAGDEADV